MIKYYKVTWYVFSIYKFRLFEDLLRFCNRERYFSTEFLLIYSAKCDLRNYYYYLY